MKEDNLDKLFQKKLADFQELPDEKVWRTIEASLEKKKQSRQILPIWWKAAGIAAVLAILFFTIDPFTTSDMGEPTITDIENKATDKINGLEKSDSIKDTFSEPTGITSTEKEVKQETKVQSGQIDQGTSHPLSKQISNETLVAKGDKNEAALAKKNTEVAAFVPKEENRSISDTNPGLANVNKNPNDTTAVKNKIPVLTEDKIVDNNTKNERKEGEEIPVGIDKNANKKSILDEIEKQREELNVTETTNGKWSAGPSIAPVYFDAIGKGSPINSILAANSKSGNVTLSYGINVAYEVSKKVSIRSGIHKVDFGYNTNHVSFTSSFTELSGGQLKNIDYNTTAQSIIIEGMGSLNTIPRPSDMPTNANDVMAKSPGRTGTMGQQIGYLEVPLEVNYALLDSKFGIDLIGGLSSLFLTDNSVVLQSSGKTTELGEANNINSVNFSTNVGLGLNYKFTDKLKLSVEPVFKYQLNTFNDTSGNFNPYSLGVYSGFSFKF